MLEVLGHETRPKVPREIILCAEKDAQEVEFALKTRTNPIWVAEYQLQPKLPAKFKGKLPTVRRLNEAVRAILPPG